jgi:teichuronic acid exporter
MKHEVTKNKVISSLGWKMSERLSTQVIQFALQLVLARLLTPSDYGTVGLITIYITLSTVIIQGGFSDALIRKIDIDEVDLSSVFYIYMAFSSFFYAVLFVTAPFIASFYEKPILIPVLRVLGLNLFPASVNAIQQALIARSLRFKAYFTRSVTAILISGAVGITMAYLGFGIWALVAMQMLSIFVAAFVMWFTVKWRPKWIFSFSRAKGLYAYGYKLMLSNLITTLYNSLYGLIIGKVYDTSTLGYDVPDAFIHAGRQNTAQRNNETGNFEQFICAESADDWACGGSRAAYPYSSRRKVAALCTLPAAYQCRLLVLADAGIKFSRASGNRQK